jgi:inositol-phosphate transport system permease protein
LVLFFKKEQPFLSNSRTLGFFMITPAVIIIVMLFLLPVVLTAVFAFTNMSTATGISGGAYQISPTALQELRGRFERPELATRLTEPGYMVDEVGLAALAKAGIDPAIIGDLRRSLLGKSFTSRREAERAFRDLGHRPSTREVKQISDQFNRSVANARFESKAALLAGLEAIGMKLTSAEQAAVVDATYTGWSWTAENFRRMASIPSTRNNLLNTLVYVACTLTLFNIGFAMVLAITTFYMPERTAGYFRGLWLLPRISPPVLYVLLWKWLAWDTGFLSVFLAPFGIAPRNWMLGSATNAWIFVVLINGLVGASMGMLIFSSALQAIPKALFFASEVDGANRRQQIWHIILPQLRWPILFVTCYQTLSLLTSFDLILLSTNGGPGGSTEVWALATYHTALNNYAGNLEYGYGAAMALVLVIVGVLLSLLYLRLFNYRALVAKPLIEN